MAKDKKSFLEKYKWYIIGVVALLMFVMIGFFVMSDNTVVINAPRKNVNYNSYHTH